MAFSWVSGHQSNLGLRLPFVLGPLRASDPLLEDRPFERGGDFPDTGPLKTLYIRCRRLRGLQLWTCRPYEGRTLNRSGQFPRKKLLRALENENELPETTTDSRLIFQESKAIPCVRPQILSASTLTPQTPESALARSLRPHSSDLYWTRCDGQMDPYSRTLSQTVNLSTHTERHSLKESS